MKKFGKLLTAVCVGLFIVGCAGTLAFASEPFDSHADALLVALRANGYAGIIAREGIIAGTHPIPKDTSDWRVPANWVSWGYQLDGMMYDNSGPTLAFNNPVQYVDELTHAYATLLAIRANSCAGLIALDNISGTIIPQTGLLTGNPNQVGAVWSLNFTTVTPANPTGHTLAWDNPASFATEEIHASNLLNELRLNSAAGCSALFTLTGKNIPSSGKLAGAEADHVDQLFSLMYNPDGSTNTAYSNPGSYVAVLVAVNHLNTHLKAATLEQKAAFNAIYGISADTDPATGSTFRQRLFDTVSGNAGFDIDGYIMILPNVTSLHAALQGATAEQKDAFLESYGIGVHPDYINGTYVKALFDIVGTPGYIYGTPEENAAYFLTGLKFDEELQSGSLIISTDLDSNGQKDLVIDFGDAYGIWIWNNNTSWSQLHTISAKSIISTDLDNNGQKDLVIDFGDAYGIWTYNNNTSWRQLHTISAKSIISTDLDNNGQKDLVIDFGDGYGIWIWNNNTSWSQLYTVSPSAGHHEL